MEVALRFLLAVGVLACAGLVRAVDAPLTLPEAQRRAAERSRLVAAQDAAVSASRELAVAAARLPDPVLKLGVDNLPVNGPDQFSLTRDFMTMQRIGVMQEWTSDDKRRLRAERFGREAEKSRAERLAAIAAIHRDTALAWLERYYAEAMAAVIAEQSAEVRREIAAAESAYRGGRGSQAEVLAAHQALAALEDRASEFRRRVQTAKTALARWMGEGADAPLGARPAIDTIALDAARLEDDLAHHPQIAIFSTQAEVAAAEARLARANRHPDWSFELAYQQRGAAYSNMVSFGVSIPLPWDRANRQDREVASKLALQEQAQAQKEEALRAHVAEVAAMIVEWRSGRERLARYEKDLLPLSKERTRAVLAAYQGGKASLAEVLAGRRSEIEVRMQALQLEMDTARLWAQLNFLLPAEAK